MLSKMILIGRLGTDPEQRQTNSGHTVTNFSVATDVGWGEKKETQWYSVTAWSKLAELCGQYLRKGRMVYVEGVMRSNKDQNGKEWWSLNADEVKFLDSPDNQTQDQAHYNQDGSSQGNYDQSQGQDQGGYDGYGGQGGGGGRY